MTAELNSAMTYSPDADFPLVVASRNGDISAFEELVAKYDRKLLRIAQNITHSPENAEEVVQSAFLKAFQNLNRFRGNAKFSTWLVRITVNESLMKVRKQRGILAQSLTTTTTPRATMDNSHLRLQIGLRVPKRSTGPPNFVRL